MIIMKRFLPTKQFISGLIFGALILVSGTALAESTIVQNLIGQEIQGQFPVTVDGKLLDMPAAVLNGTSYVPLRAFAEGIGYAVSFDTEGGVDLKRMEGNTLKTQAEIDKAIKDAKIENDKIQENKKIWNENYNKKSELESSIELKKQQLEQAQGRIARNEAKMTESREFFEANKQPDDPTTYESRTIYTSYTDLINADEAEVIRLTAEIKALEAQLQTLNETAPVE